MNGPYEREPAGARLSFEDRYEVLMDALEGVTLGTYDEAVARWLCHNVDTAIFPVVIGWLKRAKGRSVAGPG
jgi:hypothetical protein